MSQRLRELIRQVRACKTAADERDVISKESASIRSAFKDDDNPYRHRNVAKLLFMHLLGYPTHFGQMECVKLIASPKFPEKRIGYLGLMLLLDENVDVLMLVTNSLKQDLENANQYIAGLALTSLSNVGSADMMRDLSPEIERMMTCSNGYLRKKAVLCAVRLARKCPELCEGVASKISALLSDRNHGVLVSTLTLLEELLGQDTDYTRQFKQLVPSLTRLLRNMMGSGYSPEHDVSGITDPFVQVKILRCLRLLGADSTRVVDECSDLLALVATNTEATRNAGNAVLYECVQCIVGVPSESGLRVLAINILGRFLLNRDNNMRYVALNTLAKVAPQDPTSVQRHRNTIVDCLKDPDVSIRKRALELIALLANEKNVRTLVKEMLNYLGTADQEFKRSLTEKTCDMVQKFSPHKKWLLDTMLKILIMAGEMVPDHVTASLTNQIASAEELQIYAVHKFYNALVSEQPKEQLLLIGIWCVGEYGELLSESPPADDGTSKIPSDSEIIDLMQHTLIKSNSTVVAAYTLNALAKLSTRLSSEQSRISSLIKRNCKAVVADIQQRACEYTKLLNLDDLALSVMEHMPSKEDMEDGDVQESQTPVQVSSTPAVSATEDLLGDLDLGAPSQAANAGPNQGPAGSSNMEDLLSLMDDPAPQPAAPSSSSDLLDLLSDSSATPAAVQPQQQSSSSSMAAVMSSNGVFVDFNVQRHPTNTQLTQINVSFRNTNSFEVESLSFQVAVPKTCKLQIQPATGSSLPAGSTGAVTQVLRVSNSLAGQKPLALRCKLDFVSPTGPVQELGVVSNFPAGA